MTGVIDPENYETRERGHAVRTMHEVVGVAIESGYPDEAMKEAVESLVGVPVTDRSGGYTAETVVGRVTDAEYDPDSGIRYEAEIGDDEIADRIDSGLVSLAPRIFPEENTEMFEFDRLFATPRPTGDVGDIEEVRSQ